MWIYPVPWKGHSGLGPLFTSAVLFTHDGVDCSRRTHCNQEPRSILGSLLVTTLTSVCVF